MTRVGMNPRSGGEMKTTRMRSPAKTSFVPLVALLLVPLACKDDDPCDPDQEERNANACYPTMAGSAGASGSAGTSGNPGDGPDSGAPADEGFVVGQPCADTAASSDCGGAAPICAALPSGSACTQILCLEGEPNAGACPADWPCTEIPGYPSTCLNL
jgi:hypothetical protein